MFKPAQRFIRFATPRLGRPNLSHSIPTVNIGGPRYLAQASSPLVHPQLHSSNTPPKDNKLAKIIADSIKATGPITVSQYIQLCLSHPTEGYYMQGDVFGSKGDFVTSPEISQVFGELLGVWLLSQWIQAGNLQKVKIVELGPGRGTLMDDVLRTFSRFKHLGLSVSSAHLVETSEALREIQKKKLGDREVSLQCHDRIEDIPADDSYTMVLAHEFFDALPIHVIENTAQGYRDVFVDIDRPLSNINSPLLIQEKPRFRFALAPGPTPMASVLSASSPRFANRPIGSRLEVSPTSWAIARKVGELVNGAGGGAALIVDYGDDCSFGDSFRAFRHHKVVDVFSDPGKSDLTANVDFAYLKEAISPVANCHGPVTQRDFLLKMGLQPRVDILQAAASDDSRRKAIKSAALRLVDETGMGKQYKVMAITSGTGKEAPYPFIDA